LKFREIDAVTEPGAIAPDPALSSGNTGDDIRSVESLGGLRKPEVTNTDGDSRTRRYRARFCIQQRKEELEQLLNSVCPVVPPSQRADCFTESCFSLGGRLDIDVDLLRPSAAKYPVPKNNSQSQKQYYENHQHGNNSGAAATTFSIISHNTTPSSCL
jgi:hypothetical protein